MLEIRNIYKHFGEVKAVDDISFSINEGEFVALLGPNGPGKSTLVEMIEGIQKPDKGNISVLGMNWNEHSEKLHRIIGISLQENNFTEKISVYETVNMFASLYGLPCKRVDEVLELVNLIEKKDAYTSKLSGGQKQRMALAISLLNDAKILLLDEPTTGLDPTARRDVWDLLRKLHSKKNIAMILTTHYMEEAEFLCDRIIMLDKGKVLADGNLNQLLNLFECKDKVEFAVNKPMNDDFFDNIPGVISVVMYKDKLSGKIEINNASLFINEFIKIIEDSEIVLTDFECKKTNLDDLFLKMTGKRLDD